jgi:hypothetical protein
VPRPVTQALVVHWQPTIEYHQHRLDLLAGLRSDDLLEQFRVTPDEVGVRTKAAELTISEHELSLHPRGSEFSDDVIDLLRRAFGSVAPPQYHFRWVSQYLIPIETMSYELARQSALEQMSLGSAAASDFAMLIEGKGEDGTEWHCEFGIVEEDEIAGRLRRWVGRMSDFGAPKTRSVEIPSELPAVALFVDLLWLVPNRAGRDRDSADDIAEQIQRLDRATESLVGQFQTKLSGSLQTVAEGSD